MSQKDKRYTKKQLNRTRLRLLREEKAEARAERGARMAAIRKADRMVTMFKGCDPERTLDLLGDDA